jgi:hypothetical protein
MDTLTKVGIVGTMITLGYAYHNMHRAETNRTVREQGDVWRNGIDTRLAMFLQGSSLNSHKVEMINAKNDDQAARIYATSNHMYLNIPDGPINEQAKELQRQYAKLRVGSARRTAHYLVNIHPKYRKIPNRIPMDRIIITKLAPRYSHSNEPIKKSVDLEKKYAKAKPNRSLLQMY